MFLKYFYLLLISSGALALDREWWKHATVYEIYWKSYKDNDGDGIGDIKGIISKLDYLADIGVDTIYLVPFYPSSHTNGGYDITDYKGIDPQFGTMEDFEQLMKEIKARGMYFVMDVVINHSSDEHEWFKKSIKKIDPYTDYYIWVNPKGHDWNNKPIPPNNWFSLFSMFSKSSAWTWNDERKQFYLHQFYEKQPDLNLRNEAVKQEIKDILTFWLGKGVTGFRIDAPTTFMEDLQLRDNVEISPDATVFTVFDQCEHTFNHPDTFKFVNELNLFLRKYDRESGKPTQTAMIGETYGKISNVMKYYGTRSFPVFHLPFNFLFTSLNTYMDARELNDFLHTWLDAVPKGMTSNWALGNHDYGRIIKTLDTEYNYILLALLAMLPGTATLYYGEELSLGANHLVPIKDPYDRFFHRTPMQWDDTRDAGFTSGEPWLPVHPNYWRVNVQAQKSQENSTLNYFKDLMKVRKTDTGKYGYLKFHIISKWVLAFSRTYKRASYIIVLNLGTEVQPLDLHVPIRNLPETLTIAAASPNSGYKKGYKLKTWPNYPLTSVLRPHSAIILSTK